MRRLVALGCLCLVACSAPEPRPLAAGAAAAPAAVRSTGDPTLVASLAARIPTQAGTVLLSGRLDLVSHVGYATMRVEGRQDRNSMGLLQWGPALLAFRPGNAPADDVPADGWQFRPLQQDGSELDLALLALAGLNDNSSPVANALAGDQPEITLGPGAEPFTVLPGLGRVSKSRPR